MGILTRFVFTLSLLVASAAIAAPFKSTAPKTWKDVSREQDLRIFENLKSKANHEIITTSVTKRLTTDDAIFAGMDSKNLPEIQQVRARVLSRLGLYNYTALDIQKVPLKKSKFGYMQVLQSRYRNAQGVEVQMLERQYIGKTKMFVVTYLVEAAALNNRATADRYLDFFKPNEDSREPASVADVELGGGERAPASTYESVSGAPSATSGQPNSKTTDNSEPVVTPASVPPFDITKPENAELCKDVDPEWKRQPGEESILGNTGSFLWGCGAKGIVYDNTVGLLIGVGKLAWGAAKVLNPFDNTASDELIASAGAVGAEAYKNPLDFGKRVAAGVWSMIREIEGQPFRCYSNTEQWRKVCSVISAFAGPVLFKIATKAPLTADIMAKAAEVLKKGARVVKDTAKIGKEVSGVGSAAIKEEALNGLGNRAAKQAEVASAEAEKQAGIAADATAKAKAARQANVDIKAGNRPAEAVSGAKPNLFERIKNSLADSKNSKFSAERAVLVDKIVSKDPAVLANYEKAMSVHGNEAVKEALSADKLAAFKSPAAKEQFVKDALAKLSATSKDELIAAKDAAAAAEAAAKAAETPGRFARAKQAAVDVKDRVSNTIEARRSDGVARKATAAQEKAERAAESANARAGSLRESADIVNADRVKPREQRVADARVAAAASKAEFAKAAADLKQAIKDFSKAFNGRRAGFFAKDSERILRQMAREPEAINQFKIVNASGGIQNFLESVTTDAVKKMSNKEREAFIRTELARRATEVSERTAAAGASGSYTGASSSIAAKNEPKLLAYQPAKAAESAEAVEAAEAAAKPRAVRGSESVSETGAPAAASKSASASASIPATAASTDAAKVGESLAALGREIPASALDDFRAALKLGKGKSIDEMEAIIKANKAPELAAAWRSRSALSAAERAKALVADIEHIANPVARVSKDVEKAVASTRSVLGSQVGYAGNTEHLAALDRAVSDSLTRSPNSIQSMVQALAYHEGPNTNLVSALEKSGGLSPVQKALLKQDIELASSKLSGEGGIVKAYEKEFREIRALKSEDPGEIAGLIANAEQRGVDRATIKKTISENMGKCTVPK